MDIALRTVTQSLNRTPICCLCFDGIRAQHPGVTLGAGQNPSPPPDRSRESTTYPRHELGVADDPADRKPNRKTGFPAYLRPMSEPADAPVPECRTPIRSKGKQQIGVLFCRKRSIEMETRCSGDRQVWTVLNYRSFPYPVKKKKTYPAVNHVGGLSPPPHHNIPIDRL